MPYLSLSVLILSILSYSLILPKNLAYLATLSCIFFFALYGKKSGLSKFRFFFFLTIIYAIISLISILNYGIFSVKDIFQAIMYPFSGLLLLIFGAQMLASLRKRECYFLLFFFLFNGVIALSNSLFGPFNIPSIGVLPVGRVIFGTSIPSSAGLLWNVNYYSITQAIGFWLCFYIFDRIIINKRLIGFCLLLISLSVLIGSSRSISLGFVFSIIFYFSLKKLTRSKAFILIITIGAILLFSPFIEHFLYGDWAYQNLRIYKGFNSRDLIWDSALKMISTRPILGWGSISSIENALITDFGAPTTSVQNSIILSVVRVGFLGTIFWVIIVTIPLLKAFRCTSCASLLKLLSAIILIIIDSFFRTYSYGGVGFIPLIFLIYLSVIYRHKNKHSLQETANAKEVEV